MTQEKQIEEIHQNMISDRRQEMVRQIDEYLPMYFFPDYLDWLRSSFCAITALHHFADATNSYFRIKGRG